MASGIGKNGQPSRCFPFMQDFVNCMVRFPDASCVLVYRSSISIYVTNLVQNEHVKDAESCRALRDDYLICLHPSRSEARQRQRAINQVELDQVRRGEGVIEPEFIDRYPHRPQRYEPRGDRVRATNKSADQ